MANLNSLETDSSEMIQPISLADLWQTLLRRKTLIAATAVVFLFLGLVFYAVSPNLYEAKAVVLLENQQADVQIKAVLTTDPNDQMQIPSEIQVLLSRNLMGKVIDQLGIVQNPSLLTDEPEVANSASPKAGLAPDQLAKKRDDLISRILGDLKVKQVERSRAIEITYEGRNPQIAANIVNTLTMLYIEQQLSSNLDAVRMTNEWLSEKVQETQKKLIEADTKVAQYREKAGIVDSRGIDLIEQNITELSNKLTTANANVAATESRLSAIEDKKKLDSAPEILAAPLIQNLREREAAARDELAALQNQLGPSHPKVTTARAQVNEINAKINQEIGKLAEGLRREHQAAVDNVANINEQLDGLKAEYNKYKNDNIELSALESEAQTNRAFLETLNLRFKETQSQENNKFQAPYARIISSALVPDAPTSPRGKLIMLASLIIGLGLGAGLALALDMLQRGVYNGKQIQQITGKTNIAVVPKAALDPGKSLISYADFPVAAPFSPYMHSIRTLSMFIRLEAGKAPGAKIFNFTSASAGEGKSSIVISTARQLALEGLKVLAIDCDMHQPSLTNTFGIMKKPGLNEVLKGQASLNDVLFRDSKTGAMVMGVGKLDDVHITSRGLDEWKQILDSFSSQFDIVLLDSPPIVPFPESKLLAKLSQNILCVRWKKTPVKLLGFAIDTLERLDCKILGTVITMSESKQNFVQDGYRS